jgi:hypothetical protein
VVFADSASELYGRRFVYSRVINPYDGHLDFLICELIATLVQCNKYKKVKKRSKAIPVTGRGGLYGCEMLRIPHCLDSRLTDGGKAVSPTHRPLSTPQKISSSGTHFS